MQKNSGTQEEARFDEGVAKQIGHHRGESHWASYSDCRKENAGVADGRECEHSLQMVFGIAHEPADEYSQCTENEQNRSQLRFVVGKSLAKDDETQAGYRK